VITDDQVLTARMLKLVNSSFYGFPQKISTITGAIVLLGFDAIRNLLLTTSVFDMFSSRYRENRVIQENFWDHSLGCAIGAKVIGAYMRYEKVEELFVSGLLHDIGKIVEMLFLPDDFAAVRGLVKTRDILMIAAEEEILGFTHPDVGKLLAEKWNLPLKLVNILEHHHHPEQSGRFIQETSIIHLADILCRAIDLGSGGDNKIPSLNPEAWASLKLKPNVLEPILQEMEREFHDINWVVTGKR
jgi:putative nucleotidyltransferase with HDIG domain